MVREIIDFNGDRFLAICFWRETEESGFLSNWYKSEFSITTFEGETFTFNCAEQYLMWQKALLFHDDETAKEIISTSYDPKQYKVLGRKVKNFNQELWDYNKVSIMEDALYYKFTQNDNLKAALIKTNGFYLVEASPFDKIWGVGLEASNDAIIHQPEWRGQNFLGEALMKIRHKIIQEEGVKLNGTSIPL